MAYVGRLELTKLQKIKIGLHVVQALATFIAACVLIAMFTQKGKTDGRANWYIALCFLSIPPWIYLIMTQMWERSVKFFNVFAMLALDVIWSIFWLSAIIGLGVWVNEGKDKGHKDLLKKNKKSKEEASCKTFAYGTEKKCSLAMSSVGLGVPILFLWMGTSAISIIFIMRWRKGEGLPWKAAKPKAYKSADGEEGFGKDAWSTDIQEVDGRDSEDERLDNMRTYSHSGDDHELLHSTSTEEGQHPGRPWGSTRSPSPPSYRSDENSHRQNIEDDYQHRPNYGAPLSPDSLYPQDFERRGTFETFPSVSPFSTRG